jgi:hypothetical protein
MYRKRVGVKLIRLAAVLLALTGTAATAGVCSAHSPGADAPSGSHGGGSGNGKPMVVGYFDHTAAWYRRQKGFRTDQTVAHVWGRKDQGAIVVLYNDILPTNVKGETHNGSIQEIRQRIEERNADIANYLETADKNAKVKVLLQLPAELVRLWASEPGMKTLLRDYVKHWSRYRALTGFYVFDEPELKGIPASTLQEITSAIKVHAPIGRNTAALSVAYSGQIEMKPLIRAYVSASPRAFDVLLVNRYPIFRKYGIAGRIGKGSMGAKLGLTEAKTRRENLADNEFDNLDEYYDSVETAAQIPDLGSRSVYASMQAYGLRDDCDGPACKAINERKPRRSPTWNELVFLLTSVWMSGADGAVLYSHYFSLYDKALRKRLDNLETLMASAYRNLPGCEFAVSAQDASSQGRETASGASDSVLAHFAVSSSRGKPEYLVVMHGRRNRASAIIRFDRRLNFRGVEELRFDEQGNVIQSLPRSMDEMQGHVGKVLRLNMVGFGVKIFKLNYE